jgi:hypothetical protein
MQHHEQNTIGLLRPEALMTTETSIDCASIDLPKRRRALKKVHDLVESSVEENGWKFKPVATKGAATYQKQKRLVYSSVWLIPYNLSPIVFFFH